MNCDLLKPRTNPELLSFILKQRSMMNQVPEQITDVLNQFDQLHLIQWWDSLSASQRQQLIDQIRQQDLAQIRQIWQDATAVGTAESASNGGRIDRAAAPKSVVRQPQSSEDIAVRRSAEKIGSQLLHEGRIAVVTVAGGQGSRLGFEHPKGMFPIGPTSARTLFQIFAEQILARRRRHQGAIPWLVMTSDATHAETVEFFEQQKYFGLDPATIAFFRQGSLPAVDAGSGRILMDSPGSLCLSPDGHGGLVNALRNSGLLQRMAEEGVEHIFYHQVDNPTVILCDPVLLGFHSQFQSSLTTNVVRKVSPAERMGVLVDVDGHTEIIEYSELSPEQSAREDETGQWIFWAGNTAIHVFSHMFLEQLAEDGCRLPLHVARKNVPFVNDQGQLIQPTDIAQPNGIKFERFIFDALPIAPQTLIVEGDRSREFNPVKNRTGADSPETAREALSRIGREWLQAAGVDVSPSQAVEISPLVALDAEELAQQLQSGNITPDQLLAGSQDT